MIHRLYNRSERRIIRSGREADAKVHWSTRYQEADDAKKRRMVQYS